MDTEIMLGRLTKAGWQVAADPEAAQLLLVNTCAFIEDACREAVDTVLKLARHKEADPSKRLVVAGCLVQRFGEALAAELPEADYLIGVHDFPDLAKILGQRPGANAPRLFHLAPPYAYPGPEARYPATPGHFAYLKIAEGCSHHCTFCVIPRIRGPYRSRPLKTLVAEAVALAASGVKELILVAQDTTAYGSELPGHPGLPALLKELKAVPGFRWIRLLYGYPTRITRELLEVMASDPRICPYLDIPIQHGHDEVLRRMGRGYTRARIIDLVRLIREVLPGVTLRTTVLVGFPGETETHFQALKELLEELRFDHLGVFLYSPEDGAAASRFPGQVPRRDARRRARILKGLQAGIVKARLKALVGT
ncbi:MAG: 30S ribosomal protein S12 methylthiotransferase RimO, partial [Desulfobaccales bacterium]